MRDSGGCPALKKLVIWLHEGGNMNRTISRAGFAAAILAVANFAAAQNITVSVDGQNVNFAGQDPTYRNGRVLVPLRGVFEEMGAYVQWNPGTQMVTATKGDTDVRLKIGDRQGIVNGRTVMMDVPATLVNGRTLVPLRFLSESLGAQVV